MNSDIALFASTLLGAVVGFISNVLLNYIGRKLAVRKLMKKIKLELEANKNMLEKKKDDLDRVIKFESPLWNLVAKSKVILDIDPNTYLKIVNIYVAIKQLNNLEKSIKNKSTIDALDDSIKEGIVEKRGEILKAMNGIIAPHASNREKIHKIESKPIK